MPPPEMVILILKIAVISVTVILAASMTALAMKRYKLHGQINVVFFVLVMIALLGFEMTAHVLSPGKLQEYMEQQGATSALRVHLCFSVPSAVLLPAMLYTGKAHKRRWHLSIGIVFLLLWAGTFVTGVFFLPHSQQP